MSYTKDPRVDAYIDPLPDWQQAIFREVRDIVHEADPAVEETIKRTVQPYFVLDGNICAFLAAKDHVNVFVYDGGIVPDPDGLISAGYDNETARSGSRRASRSIDRRCSRSSGRSSPTTERVAGGRSRPAADGSPPSPSTRIQSGRQRSICGSPAMPSVCDSSPQW